MAWEYNEDKHGKAADCIPLQLQTLFARMLLSSRGAVDTKDLTHSFGWTQADSFKVCCSLLLLLCA